MTKRRILINALSAWEGGSRTYLQNVLRELDRDDRGFRFAVLAPLSQVAREDVRNLDVITPSLPGVDSRARVLARVAYEQAILPIRARRFDLLYCVADVAPTFPGAPVVVALRNLNIYDRRYYDSLRLRTLERLVRSGLRGARRVVFPSRAAAALIRETIPIPEDRIAIVHHGISLEGFSDERSAPADLPYVFLAAALERHKNIGLLIESLTHVRDPALQVWIAGGSSLDPSYESELRRLVEQAKLETRVRFLGPVPYRDVLRYYRGARALVFPSLLETFGHPLLEAMVVGTPIVASDIPAFREVAADVARYFSPRSAIELARAIDQVSADPQGTRERVERGRIRVAEFSWKNSIDRLCAVFDEALR
jgi:glycosyltransferase involved in cell wall biosynthesis